MPFAKYVKEQARMHPSMEPKDAVKLCYQASFGAEHLLEDVHAAKEYLSEEFASVPVGGGCLVEPISQAVCRVNLSPWKKRGLPEAWLFEMFVLSASVKNTQESQAGVEEALRTARVLARDGKLPFSLEEWDRFMARYRAEGMGPVHHSEAYRQAEEPAYRIVSSHLTRLLPLLERVAALMDKGRPCIIAIDGRAASGKTTMAAQLERILGAGVVHMDDFFLPQALRTQERLSQPGGNVHYERFLREVLPHLASGAAFSYQRFDCARMELGENRDVGQSNCRIIEGAYSCHPALGGYMDLRVFSGIDREEQMGRIRHREGDEGLAQFVSRWIPLEENYLAACGIEAAADIIL